MPKAITRRTAAALIVALTLHGTVEGDPATTSSFPWAVSFGGAIARSGDTLFVEAFGASADRRDVTPGLAVVSAVDGTSEPTPAIDGAYVVIGDGRGGWFVGGGALTTPDVAHVLASGAIDSAFRVDVGSGLGGYVNALALQGSDLVIGGSFDTVNLVPRANVAIVDAATGAVRLAAPSISPGTVLDLATTATRLYVVGDFSTAGGQPRRNVAAFDLATGALAMGFVADTDAVGTVSAVSVGGGAVFVGGSFVQVNGVPRNRLARLDGATGQVTAGWNPGADATVVDLTVGAGSLYVAGSFTTVGSEPRAHVAAIDPVSGAVTAWRADVDRGVSSIVADGGALYLAGDFTSVNAVSRLHAAAVTAAAPAIVLPWNPAVGLAIKSVASNGTRVALAGALVFGANVADEQGLAAFNLRTGRRLPWNPIVNGPIGSMVTSGTRLVIGGGFTRVAGEVRQGLATFDLSTLELLPLAITVEGDIYGMAAAGDVLYVGGAFSKVNGTKRLNLAAVDLRTGQLLPWAPLTDKAVRTVAVSANGVIIGGDFTTIAAPPNGLYPLTALAEITFAGAVTSLDAAIPAGSVWATATAGSRLYFGGSFTTVQGYPRLNAAAVDLSTGGLLPWAPDLDARVHDVSVHRDRIHLAGLFTSVGGLPRRGVARVTDGSGALTAWAPSVQFGRSVAAFDDGVAVTGTVPGAYDGSVHFFPETGLPGQPGPPVRPAVRVDGATLRLAWHAPVVGPRPTSYVLEAGSAPGLSNLGTIPLASVSFAVGGVPPGVYHARVRAVGPAGASLPSDELTFAVGATTCLTPPTTPDPPSAVVTANALLLGWRPAGGSPPTAYRLDVGASEGSRSLGSLSMGGALSFATSGVPAGVYFVRVVASNACGDSAPSADARIGIGGAAGPPGAPLQLASNVSGNTVSFSWIASTLGGAPSGHVLEAGTGPGLSNLAVVPLSAATTFAAAGVPPGTYYLRVRAANGAGLGPPSGEHVLIVP